MIFAWLYPIYAEGASSLRKSIGFSWLIGGFPSSYIVLGEVGNYAIPSVSNWIAVDLSASFVQFTL